MDGPTLRLAGVRRLCPIGPVTRLILIDAMTPISLTGLGSTSKREPTTGRILGEASDFSFASVSIPYRSTQTASTLFFNFVSLFSSNEKSLIGKALSSATWAS